MFEIVHSLVHRTRAAMAKGLMNLILVLHGEHVTCDSLEDTAELSGDGKYMTINFVFCGTLRTIRIAIDRKNIENNTYVLKDTDGNVIDKIVSSVPGLDRILFSKLNLSAIDPQVSDIDVIGEFDD
jgi:hypothetical protein